MRLHPTLQEFWHNLQQFPWRNTAITLGKRFREDRLGLTASSLTFTTIIALVPFFTVMLAIFSAFPMFGKLQGVLQQWLVDSLIPDGIAKQVMGYVTTFASKASRLGAMGLGLLLLTAIALMLTIDKTLNAIWRVRKPRPLSQRVLVYWAAITLGPVLLAGSIALTSYVISSSRGLATGIPGGVKFALDVLEFLLFVIGVSAMFRFVPNTQVRWSHALTGGFFVAVGFEVAKALLAVYLKSVPTYSAVYGTFATVPILLLWIYIAWLVLLFGAVISAYAPSLLNGVSRRPDRPGWRFVLALEILKLLDEARQGPAKGMSSTSLASRLGVDVLELSKPLDELVGLDWVGRLEMQDKAEDSRWVLLCDTAAMSLGSLEQRLLLPEPADFPAYIETRMRHSHSVHTALKPD